MAQPPTRSILAMIFRYFINSLKPRRFKGDLKGVDYYGNNYYEIPLSSSSNRTRPSRYFEPAEKENFEQELPAEWEAWLRHRRRNPPTDEEVMRNYAIIKMKQKNATAIDAKHDKVTALDNTLGTYPKRPDYEITPGKSQNEN